MTTEIFRCVAGSRLFGTAVPTSDTDYKAVHIPDARSILLGTADAVIDRSTGSDSSSNTAEDVDMVSFPLQRFLKNLSKMETNSLEMLFAPNEHDDWLWEQIKENRFRIMTANKKAFTGYAKGQAMRYAVRGDRLDALQAVVTRLESMDPKVPIKDQMGGTTGWWLPEMPNVRVFNKPEFGSETLYMSVFGRECPLTNKPPEALRVYRKPIEEAGKRARDAAGDGGPDWKGLYHAQRVVDEGIELFTYGSLQFPCADAPYYRAIRAGTVPLDRVLGYFEDRLVELEELTPLSDFRDKPDQEWIDEFVYSVHEQQVVGAYEDWKAGIELAS